MLRYSFLFLLIAAATTGSAFGSIILPDTSGYANAGVPPNLMVSTGAGVPLVVQTYFNGLVVAVAEANALGPTASASATGDAQASASYTYYMLVGGTTDNNVPLTVSGITGASIGPELLGSADAYAFVDIIDITQDKRALYLWNCVGYGCLGVDAKYIGSGYFTEAFDVHGGDLFTVTVAAAANPNNVDPLGTAANAVADPFFQIDPTFLASNPKAFLQFSAGVSNDPISSTPEPSSFATLFFVLTGGFAFKYLNRVYVTHHRREPGVESPAQGWLG